jgi:aryl-alcohol dehydrogenase-like predicted oxidoreductase
MHKQVAIGLGCVTFGREIDQKASFEMMDYATVHGIKMFDTAAAYGGGASEKIIGLWLKSNKPATITIATKILPPFEPAHILAFVDNSLKNLRVDAIDILYLHRWDQSCETIESLSVLDNLIRKGKIKALGASNFSANQLQKLLGMQLEHNFFPIRFVQNNHNLAVSDIDNAFRHICKENAIEIITYSPLGAGFLTGKYHEHIEHGSRFDLIPGHQKIYFQEAAFRRLQHLKSIASHTGYMPAHLALAWALHQDVSTVLVGGRKPKHIDQAIEALSFFDAAIFAELDTIW